MGTVWDASVFGVLSAPRFLTTGAEALLVDLDGLQEGQVGYREQVIGDRLQEKDTTLLSPVPCNLFPPKPSELLAGASKPV